MTSPASRLSRDYTPAFLVYLNHPDEQTMHTAYELGRAAFADRISLLEVIGIHHRVVGEVLRATTDAQDMPAIVNAAAGFMVEVLAPYEMARRGFLERADPRPGRAIDPS